MKKMTWLVAGLVVYACGMLFEIGALLAFSRAPSGEPTTTGVYRFSQNPIYLGVFLVVVGIGIASASWVFLLIAVAMHLLIRFSLSAEEATGFHH